MSTALCQDKKLIFKICGCAKFTRYYSKLCWPLLVDRLQLLSLSCSLGLSYSPPLTRKTSVTSMYTLLIGCCTGSVRMCAVFISILFRLSEHFDNITSLLSVPVHVWSMQMAIPVTLAGLSSSCCLHRCPSAFLGPPFFTSSLNYLLSEWHFSITQVSYSLLLCTYS